MAQREENAKTVWEVIEDLFMEEEEYSHMSGDIHLSGITADEVLREIKNRDRE